MFSIKNQGTFSASKKPHQREHRCTRDPQPDTQRQPSEWRETEVREFLNSLSWYRFVGVCWQGTVTGNASGPGPSGAWRKS